MDDLRFQITAAVGAHGMWKQALSSWNHTGVCTLPREVIADPHACQLGRWLDRLPAEIRDLPGFRRVEDRHDRFHAEAEGLAVAIQRGDQAAANDLMGAEGAYARASTELTEALRACLDAPPALRRAG